MRVLVQSGHFCELSLATSTPQLLPFEFLRVQPEGSGLRCPHPRPAQPPRRAQRLSHREASCAQLPTPRLPLCPWLSCMAVSAGGLGPCVCPSPAPAHPPHPLCSHLRARPARAIAPHGYKHAFCPSPRRLILSVFSLLPLPASCLIMHCFPAPILTHRPRQECPRNRTPEAAFLELPEYPQHTHHSKKLFSIPEVAEEDAERCELSHKQGVGHSSRASAPRFPAERRAASDFFLEDRGYRFSRSATRSPDSGLDCGSEEEELWFSFRSTAAPCSPGPRRCPCRRRPRPLLARRRTLTRQSSIEEDFGEQEEPGGIPRSEDAPPSPERPRPGKCGWEEPAGLEDAQDAWRKSSDVPDSRATAQHAQPPPRVCDAASPHICLPAQSIFSPCWFMLVSIPGVCRLASALHASLLYSASRSFDPAMISFLCFRIMIPPLPNQW